MIDVDTRAVELMFEKMIGSRDSKKMAKHACRAAQEVINDQTSDNAQGLPLKDSGKGWRKLISKKTAFQYKMRRSRKTSFWHFSAINYRKPVLRISHLIEKGFKHISGRRVRGHYYRLAAFERTRTKAMKVLHKALAKGYEDMGEGKKTPTYAQFKKGLK